VYFSGNDIHLSINQQNQAIEFLFNKCLKYSVGAISKGLWRLIKSLKALYIERLVAFFIAGASGK
jgi:hypothetical protein